MKPSVDEEFHRSTFDGRVQFHNRLSELMKDTMVSAVQRDLMGYQRGLQLQYIMVSPYIDPVVRADLERQIFSIRDLVLKFLSPSHRSSNTQLHAELLIDRRLLEFDQALHLAAKHLFLPTENGLSGDFDEVEFMRQSDLSGG